MALKSMTGFGEARKAFADWVIQVELSTVESQAARYSIKSAQAISGL